MLPGEPRRLRPSTTAAAAAAPSTAAAGPKPASLNTHSPTTNNNTQQVKDAETAVLAALQGAKGRGKEGLSPAQLASLNAALAVLEADGGAPGVMLGGC
jgi:hypothetical protein